MTINQLINLTNYCGGERILLPLRFQHCRGERPRRPRGSDDYVRWNDNSVVTVASNYLGVNLITLAKHW